MYINNYVKTYIILILTALPLLSHASPPFCDPNGIPPFNGSNGCTNILPYQFGPDHSPTNYDPYPGPFDFIDQWFTLSVENLNLEANDPLHLLEYYSSASSDDLLGSLVIQQAPEAFINIDPSIFEVYWQLPDQNGRTPQRIPALSDVNQGVVPLLSNYNDLCLHLAWYKNSYSKPGQVRITIQGQTANADTTEDNSITISIPSIDHPSAIKLVKAGIVVPPQTPIPLNGAITFTPTPYPDCSLSNQQTFR